ncbi:MAG TPA: hypothetical protein VG892_04355 [Terriglobales bacterium]|jgi:hypothetical protein|nr:hypothetical protein [Terriglobales bacterium]
MANLRAHDSGGHEETVRHSSVTYDRTDLGPAGIFGFLVVLAVGAVLTGALIWGFMRYYARMANEAVPQEVNVYRSRMPQGGDPVKHFPAPQLQPDPHGDMDKFHAANEKLLNSYGWVDQGAGILHIPISRAIDIVAQKGLPARAAASAQALPEKAETGTKSGRGGKP